MMPGPLKQTPSRSEVFQLCVQAADAWFISLEDLLDSRKAHRFMRIMPTPGRRAAPPAIRSVLYWLLYRRLDCSFQGLAYVLGIDHQSIVQGVRRIEQRLQDRDHATMALLMLFDRRSPLDSPSSQIHNNV
jgi:hypothetical protein